MKLKIYLIKLIDFYQKRISPLKNKRNCVFYPTCSEYSKQAIEKYGSLKGLRLTVLRILRCHPWQKNHMDPLI
ncbi:MAG: membrane protein insertion efficiency factor YidD [Candidatus Nomurabacteria bacterium]|nr:membrane protein insertion efficiency factor YidD [Candidatus Nomurabacteria bacterium]